MKIRLLFSVEIGILLGQNSVNSVLEYNAFVNSRPKQWFGWLREEDNNVYHIIPACEAKYIT